MNGIRVGAGSSLELTGSHITRAARYGIAAFGANVAVSDSRIDHSGGPGLWVSCTMETFVCGCPERPQLRVERTELTDNHTVGLYAGEAIATLNEVAARRTQVGANFQYGQGMTFGPCTDLQADGLTVEDNADGGLLALDSSVEIRGLAARGNLRGVSVTGSQGVSIEDAELEDNVGQGVGVLEGSRLVLRGATIRHTTAKVLPVVINGVSAGQAEIGDGIDWCRGASVQLSDIALESNARLPLLIHGGVGPDSRLERITLLGSDEQTGLVWATNGGEPGPTIGDGVPPLEIVDPDSVAIPCGELVPP
jgi:hypothetical protein